MANKLTQTVELTDSEADIVRLSLRFYKSFLIVDQDLKHLSMNHKLTVKFIDDIALKVKPSKY